MSLKDKRQQAGLLQSDIAERLNIDRSTVAKWENGEALPRANRLVQLAKIYNCTIEELLVKEGKEND